MLMMFKAAGSGCGHICTGIHPSVAGLHPSVTKHLLQVLHADRDCLQHTHILLNNTTPQSKALEYMHLRKCQECCDCAADNNWPQQQLA